MEPSHRRYRSRYTDLEVSRAKARLEYIIRDLPHEEPEYFADDDGGFWSSIIADAEVSIGVASVASGDCGYSLFEAESGGHIGEMYITPSAAKGGWRHVKSILETEMLIRYADSEEM